MKLDNYSPLNFNDYDEKDRVLVEKLAGQLNRQIEQVFSAFSNQITFGENMLSAIITTELSVDADGEPTSTAIIDLTTTKVKTAIGTIVIMASPVLRDDRNTRPNSHPFITFAQEGSKVRITHISGIPANIKFTVRFIVLGG